MAKVSGKNQKFDDLAKVAGMAGLSRSIRTRQLKHLAGYQRKILIDFNALEAQDGASDDGSIAYHLLQWKRANRKLIADKLGLLNH